MATSRQDTLILAFPSSNSLNPISEIRVFLNGLITTINNGDLDLSISAGLINLYNFSLIAQTKYGNSIKNLSISIIGLNTQKIIGNYTFYIDTNTITSSSYGKITYNS